MKTCVIYLRVSSAAQAEKELPIESQLEQCEAKAKALNCVVLKVFSDEGVSGRTDVRPQFQASLSYCESFDVDYFICWSTSRFARNSLEAQLNKRTLDGFGTKVVYVSQQIDEGSSGYLHERILEIFDEHTSRQIAADTLRSMIKNARDGYFNGGRPPYGYDVKASPVDTKKKQLFPNEYEAAIVRRIFSMRLSGLGSKRIANDLNVAGLNHRGKPWSKSSVTWILKNERVVGRAIFGQRQGNRKMPREKWVVVEGASPAIVDIDSFEKVQALIFEDSPIESDSSPKSTWLFTGILRCGTCQSSMQIESASGRNARYYYYNCRDAQKKGLCKNRRIRADILDEWLSDVILAKILTRANVLRVLVDMEEVYADWSKRANSDRHAYEARLRELQAKNSRLYDLLENADGDFNLGDLAPRLKQNNAEIKELKRNIEVLAKQEPTKLSFDESVIDDVIDYLKIHVLGAKNPASIRKFYKSFIDRVTVLGDEVVIEYREECLFESARQVVHSDQNWLPELGSNQRPTD